MTGFYHLRSDTLAGLKSSAVFHNRSFWMQPLPYAMKAVNAYMEQHSTLASPEGEGFKFYFANHAFSVLASKYDLHEPLPDDALEVGRGYIRLASDLITRLAYYCILICTREMRHLKESGMTHSSGKAMAKVEKLYGAEVSNFIAGLTQHGEDGAVGKLRKKAPEIPLGHYVHGLSIGFHDGGWNGGYGGPKWGVVTDTLHQMVKGEISPEIFADIAFTLAHNGGPIFNKGMLYSHYGQFLYKLLDVQRSGQIPQLFDDGQVPSGILDADTKQYVALARKVFPQEMTGTVDWFKVESLGALNKYGNEKEKMKMMNPEYKAKIQAEQAKLAKLEASKFYISPPSQMHPHGEFVQIVERELEDEDDDEGTTAKLKKPVKAMGKAA